MTALIHHSIVQHAVYHPDAIALRFQKQTVSYQNLLDKMRCYAQYYIDQGLAKGDRVAVYLDKRPETVAALFAASLAGGVFVPINPILKPHQVAHIVADCTVKIFVTSSSRLEQLAPIIQTAAPSIQAILILDDAVSSSTPIHDKTLTTSGQLTAVQSFTEPETHRVIDADLAAILYTSGSTGRPKGVVLSHRNLVAGATSVASYLDNGADDRILSVLPLSFDYGLSQLTTAFSVGAQVVLMNYLFPRDVITLVAAEQITGLAAVPPLWIQLADLNWPKTVTDHLRYITNSGGAMPKSVLTKLRAQLPQTKPFLMYGLTEAFRSTYLPPEQLEQRPQSIGKAIPNAEILVVKEDGTLCAANEPGELVHRGIHVALGYWNDPEKTATRFKAAPGRPPELPIPELAVWSGDTVTMDEEGFLYFIGRQDEMIKTSGYRVSPTELEEIIYAHTRVTEAAAVGIPHPTLGQAIVLVIFAPEQPDINDAALIAICQQQLPAFMVPTQIVIMPEALPRNPNGKIDRKRLATELASLFSDNNSPLE
jgi:acyl-CoA ligase (AMP-forming) (exosortase A-associated)